ncbi:MAG: alpha/beta fold hydrolase [Planctomycetota bacterium]
MNVVFIATATAYLIALPASIFPASGAVVTTLPNDSRPQSAPSSVAFEPYTAKGAGGKQLQGELGRIQVPENRSKNNGKKLELAFVRFKSTNPNPGPPIFYLVGGPGPSGIEHCVAPATGRLLSLLDYGDVIGLDQRGTGKSKPNLEEGAKFEYSLPLDRATSRENLVTAYSAAAKRAVAHWTANGVDLSAFNTNENADDVEDLRRALGLGKIITWGESYGTHLTLAFLRRHPGSVERSIMIRVEGPDNTWKLPSTYQQSLEQLHRLVADDPGVHAKMPDFMGSVKALLSQLKEKPAVVDIEDQGKNVKVTVGSFDLQYYLANSLGLAFEMRDIPKRIHQMQQGDFTTLARFALEYRRSDLGSAMALMMDCASGATPARLQRIHKEAADPVNLLGNAANTPFPELCAACGSPDLGDSFRNKFKCDVPVLFVSGDLDAKTPPSNVDEVSGGFTNHTHILVRNAAHESIEMLSADYRKLLKEFLLGAKVASGEVVLPTPKFRAIE